MSTVHFKRAISFEGASYLIRVAADLQQGHLMITDLDIHVQIDLANLSATELTSGPELSGDGDLRIDCYGDGHATHLFKGIRYDGRIASRTPRKKFALLKFRYPTAAGAGAAPGWIDMSPDAESPRRISTYYPTAHAQGTVYPGVHLEHGAAVHHIGLSGLDGLNHDEPAEAIDLTGVRPLTAFTLADHPNGTGAKLGLHSFRTNACPWLDAIVHQDVFWRMNPAGNGNPLGLTVNSPGSAVGAVLTLQSMAGGRLFYTEAGGDLARMSDVLQATDAPPPDHWILPAHDEWTLGRPAGRLLAPLTLGQLGKRPPLSAWEVSGEGYERPDAKYRAPVEMVIIEFDLPNVPAGQPDFLGTLRT